MKIRLEKHFGRPLQQIFSFHLEYFYGDMDFRLDITDRDRLFFQYKDYVHVEVDMVDDSVWSASIVVSTTTKCSVDVE